MPDLSAQSDALIGWLSTNGVALAIVAIVALLFLGNQISDKLSVIGNAV